MIAKDSFLSAINSDGYYDDLTISDSEHDELHNIIESSYQKKISLKNNTYNNLKIKDYLMVEKEIDHENFWGKKNRCLEENDVQKILSMEFIKRINYELGEFDISDEENIGFANIYYRLVRPQEKSDIGPLHADSWFWEISKKKTKRRIKIWIPIITNGQDAFCYIPDSHKNGKYSYEVVNRNGELKPKIVEDIDKNKLKKFGKNINKAILFHDNLIHGGLNIKESIRVSLEFTILINHN